MPDPVIAIYKQLLFGPTVPYPQKSGNFQKGIFEYFEGGWVLCRCPLGSMCIFL